uniref:Uncharacterized protein n=1 Tax=Lepeophtheirus salmonis TaxID=72036 RepID=A0A0K2VJC3_LEPSM
MKVLECVQAESHIYYCYVSSRTRI